VFGALPRSSPGVLSDPTAIHPALLLRVHAALDLDARVRRTDKCEVRADDVTIVAPSGQQPPRAHRTLERGRRDVCIGRSVMLETVWQDLRYAARSLARRPLVTVVAVLSLATTVRRKALMMGV
jgi:hypothetical protein